MAEGFAERVSIATSKTVQAAGIYMEAFAGLTRLLRVSKEFCPKSK